MANEKSSETSSTSSDPMLLGVTVPLTLTKVKASEVATAWRECALALVAAAKTKVRSEKREKSVEKPQNAAQPPTVSA
jgi:hypothetical protein